MTDVSFVALDVETANADRRQRLHGGGWRVRAHLREGRLQAGQHAPGRRQWIGI